MIGHQQRTQRGRGKTGENVEIEDDPAPVLALGQHAGKGQEQHHRRGQRGLGNAQPLGAFAQGEGDDAGEDRGLQAEAEEPAGDQNQITAERRQSKAAIAGEGAKDGQRGVALC